MICVTIFFFVLFQAFSVESETVVKTIYGAVEGEINENVRKFLGIPYASPPVNSLRWVEPRPKSPWFPKVLNTTAFAPGCPQLCDTPPHTCPQVVSEDCLYLNVYTPRNVNLSQPQPVMVFIHGGHFDQGSSGVGLYDASALVKASNLIFVTINYRLGVLGWLASSSHFSGNYGLLDQQLALEWVQDNIGFFGGDPKQVTLFGQSAGACSIRAHLISPRSKGLFHRAIMQSDPLPLPMLDLNDARDWATIFQTNTGCGDNITCLKSLNWTYLTTVQKATEKHIRLTRPIEVFFPITPVVDGNLIPSHWPQAISSGQWNQVPLMIGTMSQDALLFIYKAVPKYLNSIEYTTVLTFIYLTQAVEVGRNYRPDFFGDNRPIMSQCGTDYIFSCAARKFLNLTQSMPQNLPVYLYEWNHSLSFDAWGPNFPFCVGKVCHGSELALEFFPPLIQQFYNVTQDEIRLSQEMQYYWTNFGRTGDPNSGNKGYLKWPKWDSNLQSMEFQTPKNHVVKGLKSDICNFWDSEGYHFGW